LTAARRCRSSTRCGSATSARFKAYRELEHKGLAAGRPGQGTFIEATVRRVRLPELAGLRRSLLRWLDTADAAGLDEDGIVALFNSTLRERRAEGAA
jgi:GntR family transcriptional regulator